MDQLIIDGTAVYELDEECMCRKSKGGYQQIRQQKIKQVPSGQAYKELRKNEKLE